MTNQLIKNQLMRNHCQQINFFGLLLFLVFGYLAGLLLWGIISQADLAIFISENQRTLHGWLLPVLLAISTVAAAGIYIGNWWVGKLPLPLADRRLLGYLIILLLVGIFWPSLKFISPIFPATKNPIEIFVFSLALAVFLARFLISENFHLWAKRISSRSIYILIVLSAIIYSFLTITLYNHFQMPGLDFGLANQVIWHYSHWQIPTASSLKHLANMWGDHFNPILLLAAPLYWLWSDPKILLIFDALIVCAGSWMVFRWSQEELKNSLVSLVLAFGYLMFIGVQLALVFPFRGDTLATTFLIFAIWFLWKKRWFWYFLMVILILMSKESFGLYILFLGIFAIVWRREKLVGSITAVLGAVWFAVMVGWLVPHFRHHSYHIFTYLQLGNSFPEVIKTILLNPFYAIKIFFSPAIKINTMLTLFGAAGFLIFAAPVFLILAIPMLAERFLSADPSFWFLLYHYSITLSPVIFVGAIFGIKKLVERYGDRVPEVLPIISGLIFFSSLLISIAWRTPLLNYAKASFWRPEERVATLNKAIKKFLVARQFPLKIRLCLIFPNETKFIFFPRFLMPNIFY